MFWRSGKSREYPTWGPEQGGARLICSKMTMEVSFARTSPCPVPCLQKGFSAHLHQAARSLFAVLHSTQAGRYVPEADICVLRLSTE